MRSCGIDAGVTGAISLYEVDIGDLFGPARGTRRVVDIIDIPFTDEGRVDTVKLKRWFLGSIPDCVWIEIVRMHGKVKSPAAIGKALAVAHHIEGIIECLGIPMKRVEPSVWKKRAGLLKDVNKKRALALGREVAGPDATAKFLKLEKHHNRAESLCLAVYGAEKFSAQKRVDVTIGGKKSRRRN